MSYQIQSHSKWPFILAILFMFAFSTIVLKCHGQTFDRSIDTEWLKTTEMSVDPTSPRFVMFFQDKLYMESAQIPGKNMYALLQEPRTNVLYTDDSIYFVLKKNYYKIYIQELSMAFLVKATKTDQISHLGDHLILFIKTIRDYRKMKYLSTR